jgi:hypothetical protein
MTKFLLFSLFLLAFVPAAHAQMGLNAPAGLSPVRDMEIYSRDVFVVQQKYNPTTAPISGTFTMNCAALSPNLTASAGVLLDPGGTGNYLASITCTQTIVTPSNPLTNLSLVGYELTFTQFGTEANGDSVVIEDLFRGRIAFSGSALPPVLLVPGYQFKVIFKADNDGNVGSGFSLRWRRVIVDPAPTSGGDGQFGKSLQFDLRKGALVSGLNGVGALQQAGDYSTALGRANKASGDNSTALGVDNEASGNGATAMGVNNMAGGDYATAFGRANMASGNYATASGRDNTASGNYSTVLGVSNTVSGRYATASGLSNRVSGDNSTALGASNEASGDYSTASGDNNTTSGESATAFGRGNIVSGNGGATALGSNNTVSGLIAMAMGASNTASGDYSTAMGNRMNTNNRAGAFMIGDTDPLGQGTTNAGSPDQFVARFRNGYLLLTSGNTPRTGVQIGADGTSWGTISDSTRKERFLPIDGPELLRKISGMKLTTWNYKQQRDRRHYGPMAQEFFALFGHDTLGEIGCDTLITTQDIEGLTLSAVQALVRENEQLKTRLNAVENENEHLRVETQNFASLQVDMNNRLHLLERAMLTRRERVTLRKSKP